MPDMWTAEGIISNISAPAMFYCWWPVFNYVICFRIYWKEINDKKYVTQYINQTRSGFWKDVREAFGEDFTPIVFFIIHLITFSVGTFLGALATQSNFIMSLVVKFMAGLAVFRAGRVSNEELPTIRIA